MASPSVSLHLATPVTAEPPGLWCRPVSSHGIPLVPGRCAPPRHRPRGSRARLPQALQAISDAAFQARVCSPCLAAVLVPVETHAQALALRPRVLPSAGAYSARCFRFFRGLRSPARRGRRRPSSAHHGRRVGAFCGHPAHRLQRDVAAPARPHHGRRVCRSSPRRGEWRVTARDPLTLLITDGESPIENSPLVETDTRKQHASQHSCAQRNR